MELVHCSITTLVTWEVCSNPHSSLTFWLADRHACKLILHNISAHNLSTIARLFIQLRLVNHGVKYIAVRGKGKRIRTLRRLRLF